MAVAGWFVGADIGAPEKSLPRKSSVQFQVRREHISEHAFSVLAAQVRSLTGTDVFCIFLFR